MLVTPSVVAIVLGAGAILLGLFRVLSLLAVLEDGRYKRYWKVLSALMLLFFVGYLAAAAVIALGHTQLLQLLVGAVFFGGAVFVFLVVQVGYLSIQDLVQSRNRLQRHETELERLYEVTDVLNRVLRHNLRNTMNVIIGRSELARNEVDSEHEHHLRTIEQTSNGLVELSQKARKIKETIDTDIDTEQVTVAPLVSQAVERTSREYPAATFETEISDGYVVNGNTLLGTALEYVLENAVTHTASESPSVTVTATAENGMVAIEVTDDGPGIPETEIEAIRDGTDNPLKHGSGLGLWLVHWILDLSDGRVEFTDTDTGGTTVRLLVPRADCATEQATTAGQSAD